MMMGKTNTQPLGRGGWIVRRFVIRSVVANHAGEAVG